jgi:nicotinic acid mononucleotide adenylyltransferase
VSATVLRERLAAGERPAELVPAAVLDYIESHRLYGARASL